MPRKADSGGGRPSAPNSRLTGAALALLRLFVGIQFVVAGFQKWDWIGTPQLAHLLTGWAKTTPFEGYGRFLTQAVIPHASLFTYLLVFGELCIGVLLALGLLTRAAALLALALSVNFLLAAWDRGADTQRLHEAFIAISLALLLTGAGRFYGLDVRLARRHPRWILW